MLLGFKIFGAIVGFYAAAKLGGIAIEWLGEIFEALSPRRYKNKDMD